MSTEAPTETLGTEGDTCSSCGSVLATDQRYCLNCGAARAEPRLDFQRHLTAAGVPGATAAAPAAARPLAGAQWSPIAAVGAIAVLGVMLLLGVLIGKDDNSEPTVAAAATTTTTAAVAPVAAAPVAPAAGKAKGGATADAAGGEKVVQGGSGSTEGISTDDPLAGLTGEALQEAQKNAPDVTATDGAKAPLDPNGQAGGGSDSTCIGC